MARTLLGSGIGRGDFVAVWMANHSPWAALYFGVLKIGAVLVPLNTRSRPDELVFALENSSAKMFFFKREKKGRTDYGDVLLEVLPRAPQLAAVVDVAGEPMTGTLSWAAFLERGAGISQSRLDDAKRAVRPRDEAVIVYTSGTTSVPKGTQLYHEGMLHSVRWSDDVHRARRARRLFQLAAGLSQRRGVSARCCARSSTGAGSLPSHAYFDPGDALAAIEDEGVTVDARACSRTGWSTSIIRACRSGGSRSSARSSWRRPSCCGRSTKRWASKAWSPATA